MHQRAINAGSILSDASSQARDLKSCSIGPQSSYEEPTPTANTSKLLECTLDTRPDERRKGAIRLVRFFPRAAYVKELGKSWNPPIRIRLFSTFSQSLLVKETSVILALQPRQRTHSISFGATRAGRQNKISFETGPDKTHTRRYPQTQFIHRQPHAIAAHLVKVDHHSSPQFFSCMRA
ncbi:hypothetical protein HYALB_00007884 [Hymenoscyphus albidus]|uniref:Uncharacterized protein n=1 Tax=Hymenoscyphus albidus TaxID=595503 RepID=A0A9N9LQD9_9HELO|nr:hypothetical protein HYALB_00007884 [Hymenoscyphus albidus]